MSATAALVTAQEICPPATAAAKASASRAWRSPVSTRTTGRRAAARRSVTAAVSRSRSPVPPAPKVQRPRRRRDVGGRHVGGQGDEDRAMLHHAGAQHPVDLGRGVALRESGVSQGDLGVDSVKAAEVAIAGRVVGSPRPGRAGHAGDHHYRAVLGQRPAHPARGPEIADTRGHHQSSDAVGAGVALSRVGGVQLVAVCHPRHVRPGFDLGIEPEDVVAGYTEEVTDTQLLQPVEEIIAHTCESSCHSPPLVSQDPIVVLVAPSGIENRRD